MSPEQFQLEFFGDFFPVGDPRRDWAGNGEADKSLEDAIQHYHNTAKETVRLGFTISPNRVVNLRTNEVVWTNDSRDTREGIRSIP